MPIQKFMCAMLEIENAFAPTGPFTTAQFILIFTENGMHSESQKHWMCMIHCMFSKGSRRDGVPYIYSSATATPVS